VREPPVNVRFWGKSGRRDEMALLPLLTSNARKTTTLPKLPSRDQSPSGHLAEFQKAHTDARHSIHLRCDVVPFAAGGPAGVLAHIMADRMRAPLGQPVIIENVAGAAGSIGVG
jgi:hypothetical protein